MPDLSFRVEKAEPVPYAAAPLLAFHLCIANAPADQAIQSIALRCQIRIEPAQRQYADPERGRLQDLFGTPDRWGHTLRGMLWTHTSIIVPPFTGSTRVELPVPCTFDFNVAATKYFDALENGEVPLCLLFSGTIFHTTPEGSLQVAQVPWDREARFRLPVRAWKEMMDHYYPGAAWLCLHKDVFDRLSDYKVRRGFPTWEQALESLLSTTEARVAVGPGGKP